MPPHSLLFITAMVALPGLVAYAGHSPDTASKYRQTPSDTSEKIYRLDHMVVTSSKTVRPQRLTMQPSKIFSSDEVTSTAGVAGDICRYIATLPSTVSALGENFDNALYVRGGRPSEVVFVVDGIELENINHFSQANGSGGPVGFINGDHVKQVDFFAGNAPVFYPSRLSSVIAIDLKNGSFTRRRHSLGCKLTGGMLATEGPFPGGNGSYMLAGRYVDFSPLERFLDDRGIPRLGDLYFKGMHLDDALGDLSLTGLFSYNAFNVHYPISEAGDVSSRLHENTLEESARIAQGGCGLTYRIKRETVSHRADLSLSFRDGGGGDSLYNFTDSFFVAHYADNPVREDRDSRLRAVLATKSDIAFDDCRFLTFGIRGNYQRYRFFTNNNRGVQGMYAVCTDTGAAVAEWTETPRLRSMRLDGLEASGFAELTSETDRLKRSVGIRADYYHLLHAVALSPRLAVTLRMEGVGSFTATGGIGHQFPTDMPSLFFHFFSWFPSISDDSAAAWTGSFLEELEPLRCFLAATGFERQIASWMMLKTDLYFKWYDREYNFVSPEMQEVLYVNTGGQWALHPQTGKRRAYGIELTLNSPKRDGINYAICGSLFDVKNRYSDGQWYDDWTNVRYTASLSLGIRLFSRHYLSIGARGHGGRPFCPEVIVEDCIGRKSSAYEPGRDYYSARLDPLFNTHVRYGFEKSFQHASIEVFIDVLNLFNSQPILDYRFDGDKYQEVKPFGILPVVGGAIRW